MPQLWDGYHPRGFWNHFQYVMKHEKHCIPIVFACATGLSFMILTAIKTSLYAPDVKWNHHTDNEPFEYLRGKTYRNMKVRDDFDLTCYAPKYWESDGLSPQHPPPAPIDEE